MEKSPLKGQSHKIFPSVFDVEIRISSAPDNRSFMIQFFKENLQRCLNVRYFTGVDSAGFRRFRPVADSVDDSEKSVACDDYTTATNRPLVLNLSSTMTTNRSFSSFSLSHWHH
jgi:hypothetical protein